MREQVLVGRIVFGRPRNLLGKLKRSRPSALWSPAVARCEDAAVPDCKRPLEPHAPPRTVGSCASAGKYSRLTIEGGTFQVGLTVMYFISAVIIGVAMVGLPVTILVIQT